MLEDVRMYTNSVNKLNVYIRRLIYSTGFPLTTEYYTALISNRCGIIKQIQCANTEIARKTAEHLELFFTVTLTNCTIIIHH